MSLHQGREMRNIEVAYTIWNESYHRLPLHIQVRTEKDTLCLVGAEAV